MEQEQLQKNIETAADWVSQSHNIVFLEAPEFPRKAVFRISAVWMDCTTRNMPILQKPF